MGLTVSELVAIYLIILSSFSLSVYGDFPTAKLSTLWTNNFLQIERTHRFLDQSFLQFVIFNNSNSTMDFPGMGCGFFTNGTRDEFYFVVFAIRVLSAESIYMGDIPRVLCTANRGKPVRVNSTLELTSTGDLVLKDVDDSLVWSTNTSGSSAVGMRINGTGNLILYDETEAIIWQSFDHHTDTWLPGQKLRTSQALVASVSNLNRSPGPYVVYFLDGLYAFIESNPSQLYAGFPIFNGASKSLSLETVNIEIIAEASDQSFVIYTFDVYSKFQYIRLDSDGRLRVYRFVNGAEKVVDDILTGSLDDCAYPTVCGKYGICSNGHCSGCPMGTNGDVYFRQLNFTKPSLGCVETTQLSCESPQLHNFVELHVVSYFNFVTVLTDVAIESCKQACLKNCSCKAFCSGTTRTF